MLTIKRKISFALLLLLISSHTALSLHIATHVTSGGTICQLCTGGANPVVAIAPSVAPLLAPLTDFKIEYNPVTLIASDDEFSSCQPRAPPSFV